MIQIVDKHKKIITKFSCAYLRKNDTFTSRYNYRLLELDSIDYSFLNLRTFKMPIKI